MCNTKISIGQIWQHNGEKSKWEVIGVHENGAYTVRLVLCLPEKKITYSEHDLRTYFTLTPEISTLSVGDIVHHNKYDQVEWRVAGPGYRDQDVKLECIRTWNPNIKLNSNLIVDIRNCTVLRKIGAPQLPIVHKEKFELTMDTTVRMTLGVLSNLIKMSKNCARIGAIKTIQDSVTVHEWPEGSSLSMKEAESIYHTDFATYKTAEEKKKDLRNKWEAGDKLHWNGNIFGVMEVEENQMQLIKLSKDAAPFWAAKGFAHIIEGTKVK